MHSKNKNATENNFAVPLSVVIWQLLDCLNSHHHAKHEFARHIDSGNKTTFPNCCDIDFNLA